MRTRLPITIVLMCALAACAAPAALTSPGPSASLPVPGSASATPTSATPLSSATPAPTVDDPGQSLEVPGFATVTADRLLIRTEAALTADPIVNADTCIDNPDPNCARPFVLGTESGYTELYVFDGPVEADGFEWYLAATEMHTETHASVYPEAVGWVAAGDGEDAWLVQASRTCPSQPVELADITNQVITRLERLDCIGSDRLSLRGWYPDLPPGENPDNSDLTACRAERGWLACYSVFDMVRPEQGPWAGNADYLDFVFDPETSGAMPARGQWIEVTGSFDRPEAEACGDVAAVLNCRATFVVTSVEVP